MSRSQYVTVHKEYYDEAASKLDELYDDLNAYYNEISKERADGIYLTPQAAKIRKIAGDVAHIKGAIINGELRGNIELRRLFVKPDDEVDRRNTYEQSSFFKLKTEEAD